VVKDGLVQWIGHPMELDGPLAKIKNGTFDIKAFRTGFDRAAASERRATAARDAVQAADAQFYNGDRAGAKVALAQALRDDPAQKDAVAGVRFGWLASEDPKAWEVQAQRLARSRWSEERGRLLRFAMEKADYSGTRALARRAIAIALAADPKGFDALYTASQVYAATQAYGPALETTNKLLAYYPTGPVGGDEGFKRMLLQQKASLLGKLRSPR
jgi:thioredoxin-like negative regulator of GroEL